MMLALEVLPDEISPTLLTLLVRVLVLFSSKLTSGEAFRLLSKILAGKGDLSSVVGW